MGDVVRLRIGTAVRPATPPTRGAVSTKAYALEFQDPEAMVRARERLRTDLKIERQWLQP